MNIDKEKVLKLISKLEDIVIAQQKKSHLTTELTIDMLQLIFNLMQDLKKETDKKIFDLEKILKDEVYNRSYYRQNTGNIFNHILNYITDDN